MSRRIAIVGTAPSWQQTPWADPGLEIWSLNDAYRMPGFQRADRWYDFHPLDHFWSPPETQPGTVFAHQVPPGYYVRPSEHLAWLGRQTIPIWLHPDYAAQHAPAKDWVHAHAFPKAAIETVHGRYFTSSPAWMIAHALTEACHELHIYGIHLSTESEYIEQRPNFEYLCGRVLGPGKMQVHTSQGIRRYETADGVVVLPEASPILASDFQYAFQQRPRAALEPLKWELHKISVKQARAMEAIRRRRRWQSAAPLNEELDRLEAWRQDVSDQMQRVQVAGQWR